MQQVRSRSGWHVTVDIPQELVFLGILAQQNGYVVADEAAAATTAEAAWQKWWLEMPQHTYSTISAQVRQRSPNLERVQATHEARAEHRQWFDPPTFASLAQYPALQQASQQAWPEFVNSWQTAGGEGLARLDTMHHHLIQMKLGEQLARNWKEIAPQEPPLQLTLTGVLWPLVYERWLTPTHLLCSVASLDEEPAQTRFVQGIVAQMSARNLHQQR